MENELENVVNLKIEILNENDNLVFLRKIKRGKSNRSYGIEVAKLSGLPDEVITNAQKFIEKLDTDDVFNLDKSSDIKDTLHQINDDKINNIKEISANININELTPIEAINKLNTLVERINEL